MKSWAIASAERADRFHLLGVPVFCLETFLFRQIPGNVNHSKEFSFLVCHGCPRHQAVHPWVAVMFLGRNGTPESPALNMGQSPHLSSDS